MKIDLKHVSLVGLGCLVPTSSALSVERPDRGNEQLPQLPAEPAAPKPDAQQQESAWLGVSGTEVDKVLKQHLKLERGLVLDVVSPGSPADEAGLGEGEIILSVNGQELGTQEELRDLILAKKPGMEVELGTIDHGERTTKKVQLGERPAHFVRPAEGFPRGIHEGQIPAEMLERLRDFHQMEFPRMGNGFEEMFRNLPMEEGINFKRKISYQLGDDEGAIKITKTNGQTEVEVRDLEGNILFSGPYETEVDKASVPESVKDRLEAVDFENLGEFRPKRPEVQ